MNSCITEAIASARARWIIAMEIFHFSRERTDIAATASSIVIRGEEAKRRVGENDVNEIENNLTLGGEIFYYLLKAFWEILENRIHALFNLFESIS